MAFNFNIDRDFKLYKRLLTYLKPYKKRFIVAILSSLPIAALQGAIAWVIGPFTDMLFRKQDFTLLLLVPVVLMVATAIQGVCQYINEYCTSYMGQSITQTLRLALFKKCGTMELGYFKKQGWSDLLTRYVLDPAQLQMTINDNLQDLIVKLATIVGLTAVLLYRNWQYALISIFIISLTVVPLSIISKKIRRMDHVTREITSHLFTLFYELTTGFKVVSVYQLMDYQTSRYEKSLKDYFSAAMRITKAGIILKPLMQFIAATGISCVFIIGVFQIKSGQMTPGDLTSFIVALVLLIQPIKVVGSVISKMQRIFAPAERVFEKLDLASQIVEAPQPLNIDDFDSVSLENVSFEYEPGKPVLRNISLVAKAGETIALVGPSGGGKSTLVDLIPRFIDPTEGRVLINHKDLRHISMESLHQHIAIVSQEAILFDTTIRENIRLGKLDATDEEIRKAMDQAYLTEWVDMLELGWNTPVGQNGGLLSGGQRQRITIARAFLKNAPLLILDEATSALDNESEAIVQQALTELLRRRTVLVIAHRLSTIKHADRILVLEKGQIIESGTHEALLAQEGLYHKLYHLQFREIAPPVQAVI